MILIKTDDDTSSLNYYSVAKDYLEAAKVIWVSPTRQHHGLSKFFLPTHMLLGFSMELFLKSWLRYEGLSATELSRRPYGHNLQELYKETLRRGFSAVSTQADLVAHLAIEHTAYGYRYMKNEQSYDRTNLPIAFGMFDSIDVQVDTHINASESYGLAPGH